MAKRKRRQHDPEPEFDESQPEDMDSSATLAAHDQLEATKTSEANELPSELPVRELPAVPLKVFIKVAGPKWDQMAGFLSYAKMKKLGPYTVPEWRAAYQTFLHMPM